MHFLRHSALGFRYSIFLLCLSGAAYSIPAITITLRDTSSIVCSPGRMGPNALPVPYVNRTTVGKEWILEAAAQFAWDPFGDTTINPWFSLFIPLRGIAGFMIFSRPVEHFSTSPAMLDKRNAASLRGTTPGDLYFQTMIQILEQRRFLTDLAFHLTLKTTTGKGLGNARHINAPAYYFNLTGAKSMIAGPTTITYAATVSFIAWQAAINAQDDAMGYGGKVTVGLRQWLFAPEIAGYIGWIENGDRPCIARLRVDRRLSNDLGVYGRMELGISDQPPARIEIGMSAAVDHFVKKWFGIRAE
jgi:hypothetical protein